MKTRYTAEPKREDDKRRPARHGAGALMLLSAAYCPSLGGCLCIITLSLSLALLLLCQRVRRVIRHRVDKRADRPRAEGLQHQLLFTASWIFNGSAASLISFFFYSVDPFTLVIVGQNMSIRRPWEYLRHWGVWIRAEMFDTVGIFKRLYCVWRWVPVVPEG